MIRVELHRRNEESLWALVDDEDAEMVLAHTWYASPDKRTTYAITNTWSDGSRRTISMHCMIMGALGVDHENHDGLDNRRANLRVATRSQNMGNSRPREGRRFKGALWHKAKKRWYAQIKVDGKQRCIGYFSTEEEAAQAYDTAALSAWGDFAHLNFPREGVLA